MQRIIRHVITGTLMYVLLWTFASCSNDVEASDVPSVDEMTLSIGFKVSTRAPEDGQYEEGTTYENYIDIPNGNYRIYFFDMENKFIARFEPRGFVVTEGSKYQQYSVLGKAPDALVGHESFKMVVLANWPEYDDVSMEAGETTIEEVCSADYAKFNRSSNFELNPNTGSLMPFYGVHVYNNVTFTPGEMTILSEPVTLLRAMAKVEVFLETDDYFNLAFSELWINRYNGVGYCAPTGVYEQGSYDHNRNWSEDYVQTLHLVGGQNDEGEKECPFRFVNRWSEGEKIYEKWETYLAEYDNKTAADTFSSIRAKFNIQLANDASYQSIYFAEYENNKTDNQNRLDIHRNNIYRFYVRCEGYKYKLQLKVCDWAGLYENIFEYGDGQIVSPVAPWEDERDNSVEF